MSVTSRFELDALPSAARIGRNAVQTDAALADLPESAKRNVTLVVSELVSNAVAAATGNAPVTVEISRNRTTVIIVVCNAGDATALHGPFALPPAENAKGRGLGIVHLLSRSVDVTSSNGVTTATAVVDLTS